MNGYSTALLTPASGRKTKTATRRPFSWGALTVFTGILDVVEADIRRRLPNKLIEDVIKYQREYHCLCWSFESVQFQEFLRTVLVERSAALGVPVPALPVIPLEDKALRIESLQPHMANGLIRISPAHQTLIDQLRHYPKADHDDGPDCLHMLWTLAVSRSAKFQIHTPRSTGRDRGGRFGSGGW